MEGLLKGSVAKNLILNLIFFGNVNIRRIYFKEPGFEDVN
jgi:hypothetical protein